MKRILSGLLVPIAASIAPISAAHAADTSATIAPQENGYERLYAVLMSDPGNLGARRVAQILVEIMGRQGNTFEMIEAEQPGFIAELEKEMLPLVVQYLRRLRSEYRPMFIAEISPQLTPGQADEIAAFYESDMGQTLLRASRRNIAMEASDEELLSDEPFTREDSQRDLEATTANAIRSIPEEEMDAINNYLAARPEMLVNLLRLREPLLRVRVAMDNEAMTASEEAEMGRIYEQVLGNYGYELLPE